MASVVKEVVIEAAAHGCWDAVRDFGALNRRLVPGFVTDLQMVGDRERRITFFTGAVATEYLVGSDDAQMRLAYTVTDSPMGSSHHNASVQVVPDGEARCHFIWITDVLPDDLAELTGELMDAGIGVIKQTLEGASVGSPSSDRTHAGDATYLMAATDGVVRPLPISGAGRTRLGCGE